MEIPIVDESLTKFDSMFNFACSWELGHRLESDVGYFMGTILLYGYEKANKKKNGNMIKPCIYIL